MSYDRVKLSRLVELYEQQKQIEAEINALFGGETVKQKRYRRTKAEIEADNNKLPQHQL